MRYVRYVGLAHVRQITADDWRRAGLNGQTVQWDAFNGFAVPLDQFNEDQIRKAIEPDASLVITGEGDEDVDFEPDTTTATVPMTPQQLEGPRVDILGGDGAENGSTATTEAFPDGVNDNATPGGAAPTTTGRGRGSGTD